MDFELLEDRIAILADEVEETTESGLIITESAQPVLRFGTIAKTGLGRRSEHTGEPIGYDVAEGDRVFFHRSSGQPLEIEGVEYIIITPRELIGVVV